MTAIPFREHDFSDVQSKTRARSGSKKRKQENIPADIGNICNSQVSADVEIIEHLYWPGISSGSDETTVNPLASLLGRTVVPSFSGGRQTVSEFLSVYNGTGLRRLAKRMSGASISKEEAGEILGEILEDALVAVAYNFLAGRKSVRLDSQTEKVLVEAISERLPRVRDEKADLISARLVFDLKSVLKGQAALAIDDGAVIFVDGALEILDLGTTPLTLNPA